MEKRSVWGGGSPKWWRVKLRVFRQEMSVCVRPGRQEFPSEYLAGKYGGRQEGVDRPGVKRLGICPVFRGSGGWS